MKNKQQQGGDRGQVQAHDFSRADQGWKQDINDEPSQTSDQADGAGDESASVADLGTADRSRQQKR